MGDIKNLFHFANLARTNWDEAVRLFTRKIFTGSLAVPTDSIIPLTGGFPAGNSGELPVLPEG